MMNIFVINSGSSSIKYQSLVGRMIAHSTRYLLIYLALIVVTALLFLTIYRR